MTIAAHEFGWGAVVIIVVGILALCFLAVIFLARAQDSHTMRMGFFVERDVPEPKPPSEQPTGEYPVVPEPPDFLKK